MIKTYKTSFKTSRRYLDRLFECNRISAQVWNDCIKIARDFAIQNDGMWIDKSLLQTKLKRKFRLHSGSVQSVIRRYLFARDCAQKAIAKGYKIKYPYKTKKYYNTRWIANTFKVFPNGKIRLSLGTLTGKREYIFVKVNSPLPENLKEIELVYDKELKLCISYDDCSIERENKNSNLVAIDQGEVHTIAAFCTNGNVIIITGRKLRSIFRFMHKKIKEIQKLMNKCIKGSRQWRKYKKAKDFILSKCKRQIIDFLHKVTKKFKDWCIKNEVKEVVIGDIEGVQRNTKNKLRKKTTQKLSNWTFGRTYKYLEYKLKAEGISVRKVCESYTTQTCPVCGRRKKTSTRNYNCICNYKAHRDIHAARNILSKFIHRKIQYIGDIENIKYLRIA